MGCPVWRDRARMAAKDTMNLAVRSVQTSADWHSALTKFEDRSIFHTSEWLDTIGETTGFELIRLEVSDRNGPVMLFPLFAKKLGGIVSLLSPPPGLALEFLGLLYRFPPRAKRDRKESMAVDYLRTLLTRFAPTNMISFLALLDGSPVGGLVAMNYNGVTAAWIGARSVDTRGIPVTDLLVWRAIEWGFEMGATRFELMGGNVQRLRPFKAKYNADLVSFFQLERSRLAGRLLSSAYRHMKAVRTRKT